MPDPRPSTNGDNGRNAAGRFTVGNRAGLGNPHFKRVAAYRRVFLSAVTLRDLRAIVKTLVGRAVAGDVTAAKVLLERAVGDVGDLHNAGIREELRQTATAFVARLFDALERIVPPTTLMRAAKEISDCHAMLIERGDDDAP